MTKVVRMIVRRSLDSYRQVSETEYQRRSAALHLEGVDGDEETDTVIYWYRVPAWEPWSQ